jgi:hypothetical protein
MNLNELTSAEIAAHHEVIRKNFLLIAELAGKAIEEEGFTITAQQRTQAIDTMIGMNHSRLAQSRALRWMRKNFLKQQKQNPKPNEQTN